jgi:hypothetical protein
MAMGAANALAINATCAVFLMENAIRLQSEGVSQGDYPGVCDLGHCGKHGAQSVESARPAENAVVLLHGQTMRGIPLTLATADRCKATSGHLRIAWFPRTRATAPASV